MTLKEKFGELSIDNVESKCEQIADEFAMEFAKWCFNVVSEKKHKGIDTVKQLLEIYKKEKAL